MFITSKLHFNHERLALVPTLRNLDKIKIWVIIQGNTKPGSTMFPFLVKYNSREKLEEILDDDPTVNNYAFVNWIEEGGVYYIENTPETKHISTAVTDVNGFVTHMETKGNGWFVRLILPDREALNAIWKHANENNITLDIIGIYDNDDTGIKTSYGLTNNQKVALKIAYEKGYFREPRDISLSDVADEIDLSPSAMNGRLRRGMRNLIAATILEVNNEN